MLLSSYPASLPSQSGLAATDTKRYEMKIYNYTVIFEPVNEGGYNVIVPAIPETGAFGQTLNEAREMSADAIKYFIESVS
jgi:hypothetical protein